MRYIIAILVIVFGFKTATFALSYEEKQVKIMDRYTRQLRIEYGWADADITELRSHLERNYENSTQRVEAMRHVMVCVKHQEKNEWKIEEGNKFRNTEKLMQKIQARKKEMKQLKLNMSGNNNGNREKSDEHGNGQGLGK